MRILGISAFYHDSAAALIDNGSISAAAQEERFTRKKHDARFPHHALEYCLQQANLSLSDIDYVAFYDKPFLKFERLLETYLAFAPKGLTSFRSAMPVWIKDKLFQRNLINDHLQLHASNIKKTMNEKLLFSEHHLSHAASAFYPSPFNEALVLTMDGVGEWATTSVAIGKGNGLEVIKEIHFPHSLGLLYSAFTYYTGFKVNSGEYKVMGLAPYGQPKYVDTILDNLIDLKDDGSFKLNMKYFDYCTGLRMTNKKFDELFGGPPRAPEKRLTQREMDLAASIQQVIELAVLRMTKSLANETGMKNLCLAGGVALNCVANGKVLQANTFDEIWIQPAAGDAGGALGAALMTYHGFAGQPRQKNITSDTMCGSYLGPNFEQSEIEKRLSNAGAVCATLPQDEMIEAAAQALNDGKAIGWFQGKMEFGPRALGNRSILADPRSEKMQKTLNLKVKFRESFRPFAPSVLREDVAEWFDLNNDSPYMLLVADVHSKHLIKMTEEQEALFGLDKLNVPRSTIPAITHVDYSARVQTVHKETNPLYHQLINTFKEKTGCPVVVNTSFNIRGEPIVCTPEDAFRCFMGTELDVLVCGNCILYKDQQSNEMLSDYKNLFELD